MTALAIIFGVLTVGMALVIYGTLARNRWGINPDAVSCPHCNTPLPQARRPRSFQQAMWGGWTCPACGAEADKWGRTVGLRRTH
jgi:hypothetical protein